MLSEMPNRFAVRRGDFVIAHHQGLFDQRFDAAQARTDSRQLDGIDDIGRLTPIGILDEKRNQSAIAAHGASSHVVIRMRGQSRIIHAFDARMSGQELGDRLSVLVVALHAEFEGLEAALQEIEVVGRIDRPHDAAQFADRFHRLPGGR